MSKQTYLIPRHANAGVVLFGVEFKDAWIFIFSVFLAIVLGFLRIGSIALGILFFGYLINRAVIGWKKHQLPGSFRAYMFSKGLMDYSSNIRHQKTLYVGDAVAINRGSRKLIDSYIRENKGG